MSEKEISPFSDPAIIPTEELIKDALNQKYPWFREIIQHAFDSYKQVSDAWKYYQDGKQWLYRMLYRKKTIFWMSVQQDTFRITFYFSGKSESSVMASNLPEYIKNAYMETRENTFRAISMQITDREQIKLVCQLLDLKIQTG